MARKHNPYSPRRKAPPQRKPQPQPRAQLTPSPGLERQIRRRFFGLWFRVGIIFFGVSIATTFGLNALKLSRSARVIAPYAIAFGIALPMASQMDRHFRRLRATSADLLKQRNYADARVMLEPFHRFGNMTFDRDGEAHYLLTRALIGLGEMERAEEMAAWVQRYRKNYPFAEKAALALASAPKPRALVAPDDGGEEPDTTDES
jgi:hypothetical protein